MTAGFAPPAIAVPQGRLADVRQRRHHDARHHRSGEARRRPVFKSPFTGSGGTSEVKGVDKLAAGTYPFFCSLHTNMQGELQVF